ncbi:MAG: S49 family peptidase [Micavibrio sp.]|nr:S49 family peptidase [Micavibrio sp.]
MCIREIFCKIPGFKSLFSKKPYVSVIRLSGVISDGGRGQTLSFAKCQKAIEKAFNVYDAKAVAIIINSPGGSPAQSALIGNLIRQKAIEKDIPVFAFVEDVAASGGYWLACAADEIYAQETSIVGSIGVISASFGLEDFIKRYDIKRRYHTAGESKGFMDPFLPEKEADLKRLKTLQADIHESFIAWVKGRRGDKLKGKDKELFTGEFWTAKRGLPLGLVDGLGDYLFVMKEKYGAKTKFVENAPDKGLIAGLLSGGNTSQSLADDIVVKLKSVLAWSRYGL